MASIVTALKDLVASIFEVIFSTIKTAFDGVYGVIHAFVSFIASIPGVILHTIKSILEAAGGVGKFIASEYYFLFYLQKLPILTTNANRQFARYRSHCRRRLCLSGISTSSRSYSQGRRQEVELNFLLYRHTFKLPVVLLQLRRIKSCLLCLCVVQERSSWYDDFIPDLCFVTCDSVNWLSRLLCC